MGLQAWSLSTIIAVKTESGDCSFVKSSPAKANKLDLYLKTCYTFLAFGIVKSIHHLALLNLSINSFFIHHLASFYPSFGIGKSIHQFFFYPSFGIILSIIWHC